MPYKRLIYEAHWSYCTKLVKDEDEKTGFSEFLQEGGDLGQICLHFIKRDPKGVRNTMV